MINPSLQISLPLWKYVIFVDWHGVLSTHLFWHNIVTNSSHRLHSKVKSGCDKLFGSDKQLVRSWMRGEIGSMDVIMQLDPKPSQKDTEFLYRQLLRDCRRMEIDSNLMVYLEDIRREAFLVLATDNMECFRSGLSHTKALSRRFDYVLCSAELGVLKSDGVEQFFGPWLAAHHLGFDRAVLIDDSAETCRAFTDVGGTSIVYKGVDQLRSSLSHFESSRLCK